MRGEIPSAHGDGLTRRIIPASFHAPTHAPADRPSPGRHRRPLVRSGGTQRVHQVYGEGVDLQARRRSSGRQRPTPASGRPIGSPCCSRYTAILEPSRPFTPPRSRSHKSLKINTLRTPNETTVPARSSRRITNHASLSQIVTRATARPWPTRAPRPHVAPTRP